jgi:hypothetical protein
MDLFERPSIYEKSACRSRKKMEANCLIKNVTGSMIEKGSLTHNKCYPITGPQRRAADESTIKERIYRTHLVTLQKSLS